MSVLSIIWLSFLGPNCSYANPSPNSADDSQSSRFFVPRSLHRQPRFSVIEHSLCLIKAGCWFLSWCSWWSLTFGLKLPCLRVSHPLLRGSKHIRWLFDGNSAIFRSLARYWESSFEIPNIVIEILLYWRIRSVQSKAVENNVWCMRFVWCLGQFDSN